MKETGFYVVGGHQVPRASKLPEWSRYDRALILQVDPSSEAVRVVVDYVSPPPVRPSGDSGSILFKAGHRQGDELLVCTSTEVMLFSLPDFRQVAYLTHPSFNDLHHVTFDQDGRLVVVNTGLDMIMIMDWDGKVIEEYDVSGGRPWQRFDRDTDYRQVRSTKPHRCHPNFSFFLGGELWVTRAEQRDAVCLTDPTAPRINIGLETTHDGLVYQGNVYFTTVDGHLVIVDGESRAVVQIVDLNAISPVDGPLGWCRGVRPLSPEVVVVGFTRLRWTKFEEKLMWVRKQVVKTAAEPTRVPAHIAAYDIAHQAQLWELDIEQHGLQAVFSIHSAG